MAIQDIFQEKKTWNSYTKRVKKLPKDYQIVYKEIQKYLFKVCPVEFDNDVHMIYGIIELFEEGALHNKRVLEVTGEDVAAFCDELMKESKTYLDVYGIK